jgi:hypothetical protein
VNINVRTSRALPEILVIEFIRRSTKFLMHGLLRFTQLLAIADSEILRAYILLIEESLMAIVKQVILVITFVLQSLT